MAHVSPGNSGSASSPSGTCRSSRASRALSPHVSVAGFDDLEALQDVFDTQLEGECGHYTVVGKIVLTEPTNAISTSCFSSTTLH